MEMGSRNQPGFSISCSLHLKIVTNTVHTNERCDNMYGNKAATGGKGGNLAPGDHRESRHGSMGPTYVSYHM